MDLCFEPHTRRINHVLIGNYAHFCKQRSLIYHIYFKLNIDTNPEDTFTHKNCSPYGPLPFI
jgi:hypothetical protein